MGAWRAWARRAGHAPRLSCCACVHLLMPACPSFIIRWLHFNQLSGSIPSSLGSNTALQQLCVRCVLVVCFAHMPHRKAQRCQRTQQQPAHRHHPGKYWQPECAHWTVRARHTVQCGQLAAPLKSSASCDKSFLDNNQLTGTIPATLSNLTTLTQLCVRCFEVHGGCFVCGTEARPRVAPLLCDVPAARSTTTNSAAPSQPA